MNKENVITCKVTIVNFMPLFMRDISRPNNRQHRAVSFLSFFFTSGIFAFYWLDKTPTGHQTTCFFYIKDDIYNERRRTF